MKLSEAQARYLLHHWVDGRPFQIGRGETQTTGRACVRRGYLVANGAVGTFPSGAPFDEYGFTPEAFIALGQFFAGVSPAPSAAETT